MTSSAYESGILFTQAHKLVRQRIEKTLGEFNVTFTQWSILTYTASEKEGTRLSSVAAILNVKAPLITNEATQLVKDGLLVRIPHHSDSRAKLLIITPKGKKLLDSIETKLNDQIGQLLNGLNQKEVIGFQKALQVIIHNS